MADHEMNAVNTEPLRNANPLPESEEAQEESVVRHRRSTQTPIPPSPPDNSPVESEHESEHESEDEHESHVSPHLQTPPHQIVWSYTQQFGLQAFLWLVTLWNFLSYVASTTQTVSQGVIRSLQSQIYVFFQGSTYPYRLQEFSIVGPGVAPVEWYFDADKKQFISANLYNTTTEYTTQHLEWLSGQIKYNDLILYDITEFLQEVKWAGNSRPSAAHILSAWSLHSGIVLNCMDGVLLCTINEDGTESSLAVRG